MRSYQFVLKKGSTTIGYLTKIGNVELSVEELDATTLADLYKKSEPGLIEPGEIPIEGWFDSSDAGQTALFASLGSDAEAYTIEFPNSAGSWSFNAWLKTIKRVGDAEVNGKIAMSGTLKISGQPTLALSASAGLTTPFFTISNSAVISPAASGSVYDYVATVLTGVSSVTVTPTATAGTITVNGNVVASGVASSAIPLGSAGSITTVTIVVTETGKTPKTYTVRVVRP